MVWPHGIDPDIERQGFFPLAVRLKGGKGGPPCLYKVYSHVSHTRAGCSSHKSRSTLNFHRYHPCPLVRSQAAELPRYRRAASHNKTHTTPTASFITKPVASSLLLYTNNAFHLRTINKAAQSSSCFTFYSSSTTKELEQETSLPLPQ